MCGIAGIIDYRQSVDKNTIEKMTDTMIHRGPDGEGYLLGDINSGHEIWNNKSASLARQRGTFALGHRRLSIIDISGGSQPMTNEDGKIAIVFNGEIYNFQELRKELQGLGHSFLSDHSDTETIIHAYEQWGTACLQRLRGMFAFGILDMSKNYLFLARDRLGKKPLFYYLQQNKLVFASELKAIVEDTSIPRIVNSDSLVEYLMLGYVLSPKTIYQDIHKLKPGHFIYQPLQSIKRDIEQQLYWKPIYDPDFSKNEQYWIEQVEEELERAVKLRMISDVPLGAFLSGGLDSTAVVSLMSKHSSIPVKTFSIGFKEEDYSETKYARQVAEKYNTEHFEEIVTPNAFELLPKLAWQYDEPFGDSSAIPTYYVSKMAREHITVALSGDGGDEIFGGYNRYTQALDYMKADLLPKQLKPLIKWLAKIYPDWIKGKGFLARLSMDEKERYFLGLSSKISEKLLKPNLNSENGCHPLERFWKKDYNDYISEMQYLDTATYLPEDILVKVDRASMLCSLETRAPLLDHKLVELLGKIPSNFKIKNGSKKYLLKKIMRKDWNPEFLERKKMGFGVPLEYWFKNKDFAPLLKETILSDKSFISNYMNVNKIQKLVEFHLKGQRDFSSDIWRILFLEEWARIWNPNI